MSEKRYLIEKVEDGEDWTHETGGLITEGELKRRLAHIRTMVETGKSGAELEKTAIYILINGLPKQRPYPFDTQGNQAGISRGEAIEPSNAILEKTEKERLPKEEPCYICHRLGSDEWWYSRGQEEKLPYSPTRKDWEEWAGEMPLEEKNLSHWRDALKAWFLTAPCVPKGLRT